MPYTPLKSSMLRGCSYDPDKKILDITFVSGRTYTHDNVPEDVYDGLVSAPSPGRYYNEMIKGQY